jgi:hypothetical protein
MFLKVSWLFGPDLSLEAHHTTDLLLNAGCKFILGKSHKTTKRERRGKGTIQSWNKIGQRERERERRLNCSGQLNNAEHVITSNIMVCQDNTFVSFC